MRPIEFLGGTFFTLMQIQPRQNFYSVSLILAQAIVRLDMKDKERKPGESTQLNQEHLKKLAFVLENTHENLNMPLAIAETLVAAVPLEEWRREYQGTDNNGDLIRLPNGKTATIVDIYRMLKESYQYSVAAVVDVITAYSSEYRMTSNLQASGDWLGGQQPHGN